LLIIEKIRKTYASFGSEGIDLAERFLPTYLLKLFEMNHGKRDQDKPKPLNTDHWDFLTREMVAKCL